LRREGRRAPAAPREMTARARLRYSADILGVRGIRSWGAGVGLLVGLWLLWALAAPHAAHAATCSSSISGPNDPEYAEAERKFPSPETWNSEQWPLFDCIPQTAPKASDPEGAAGMSVNRAWAGYGMGDVTVAYMEGGVNWKH
jgi:hypothetical protein